MPRWPRSQWFSAAAFFSRNAWRPSLICIISTFAVRYRLSLYNVHVGRLNLPMDHLVMTGVWLKNAYPFLLFREKCKRRLKFNPRNLRPKKDSLFLVIARINSEICWPVFYFNAFCIKNKSHEHFKYQDGNWQACKWLHKYCICKFSILKMTISCTQGSGLSILRCWYDTQSDHFERCFYVFSVWKKLKKSTKKKKNSLAPILGKQFDQKQLTYFFLA